MPNHQGASMNPAMPFMAKCIAPTVRFKSTASKPAEQPVKTAQPIMDWSDCFQRLKPAANVFNNPCFRMPQISLESSL
jgi:hypothetical protein